MGGSLGPHKNLDVVYLRCR